MPIFKLGDEVQIVEGTALWGQYQTLHMARGRVTGTIPDAALQNRISVQFPDGTTLTGVDASMFKRAGS